MARKVDFLNLCTGRVCALIMSVCIISGAYGILVDGSGGTAFITGNDPANNTGSFVVQVDYAVYNGADATDPFGITSDYQISFILTHLGGDGETPVLNFARVTLYAPQPLSTDTFFTSIGAVGTGKDTYDPYGVGNEGIPHDGMVIQMPSGGYGANCAQFLYFDDVLGFMAGFAPGEVSKQLIVTASPDNLPASMILEIDLTDTIPGIHREITVEFIPEPSSMILFAAAFSTFYFRRQKK